MLTTTLYERIENAIKALLPLFEVTSDELSMFYRPKIRRTPLHFKHDPSVPGYYCPGTLFYFPPEDICNLNIFCYATLCHETGHYVHHQVNPDIADGIKILEKSGEEPFGHDQLMELVASYGCYILGLVNKKTRSIEEKVEYFKTQRQIYKDYGPDFLPHLARMNLKEFNHTFRKKEYPGLFSLTAR